MIEYDDGQSYATMKSVKGVGMTAQRRSLHRQVKGSMWRTLACSICLFLSMVALMGAVLTRYVRDNVLDTDRYMQIVTPLPSDPQVAAALGTFAAERLFEATNAEQRLRQQLPPRLAPLAKPLVNGLQERTADATVKIVQSEGFTHLWSTINLTGHEAVMRIARGEVTPQQQKRVDMALKLGGLLTSVRERLGIEKAFLSDQQKDNLAEAQVSLHQSVEQLRRTVSAIQTGAWLFPLAALVLLALAILAARQRRKAVLAAGLSMATLAGLMLLVINYGITQVENDIQQTVYRNAADVVIQAFYGNLHGRLIALLVLGIVIAFGAILCGPYRWAVGLRTTVSGWYRKSRAWLARLFGHKSKRR